MTLIRPAEASITQWLMRGISPKTLVLVTLAISVPLYTVKADVRHDAERLDEQHTEIVQKVDKDTYDRDVRNMQQSLDRIQNSIDRLHTSLEDRR